MVSVSKAISVGLLCSLVACGVGFVSGMRINSPGFRARFDLVGATSADKATRINLSYYNQGGRRYDHILKVLTVIGPPGQLPQDKGTWCVSVIQDGKRTDIHCKPIDVTAPLPHDTAPATTASR